MERYKKYVIGIVLILIQYLVLDQMSKIFNLSNNIKELIYFLYIFIYLKEEIYSFKSYLIWTELRKQLKCLGEFLSIILIIAYYMNEKDMIVKYIIIGMILSLSSFITIKLIRRVLYKYIGKNVLIIGVGETANRVSQIIAENRFTMYNFLGFIDVEQNDKIKVEKIKILKKELNIEQYIKKNQISEIIIALPNIENKELDKVIDKFEKFVKTIKIVPRLHKMYTFNPEIQDYDGVMLVSTKNNIMSLKRRVLKRGVDIIGALFGLLILILLCLKYALKIKEDGGPVFFIHNRIGRNLKPFKMYKFRSMHKNSEKILEEILESNKEVKNEFYTNFKLKNDPRITPIGKFLRQTSLDEFPQFLNVLKGDMSLVGPRPVVQKEVDMYYGTEMGKKIFQVKPGITGMWQANGRSDVEDYDERISLDLYYIRNWSIWLDIVIIIKTIKHILGKKGAY